MSIEAYPLAWPQGWMRSASAGMQSWAAPFEDIAMEYTHSINDVMEFAAIKTGIDGWRAYKWERMCGGDLVTGCAPDGEYKRGPRKGRPRFSKPLPGTRQQVPVTNAELNAHAARYEREECKCWRCKGSGEEFAGWSKDAGTRKRTCQSCGGTGAPPNGQGNGPHE